MNKPYFSITHTLLLFWLFFILFHSLQPASVSAVQSQCILSLLHFVFPFPLTQTLLRKAAHFTEFAILSLFTSLLISSHHKLQLPPLPLSIVFCAFVALCDETLQLFADGRAGSLTDVWLDIGGAILGSFLFMATRSRSAQRTCPQPQTRQAP